ncbi:hypothetical protein [Pantoea sp. PNA 03-3]|uniref:hypothetical protein n=1 Tax=Pantoea sp. PNA 03-3 TaxID=2135460 RepID=UPI000D754228|nr:hypothetical protein [Pantoea sp. PNA 03-3]PXV70880.1 hypothetical protein C7433_11422 [Pantoea sp. PNA 03-3]
MTIQSLQFRNGSVSLGSIFVSSWGYEQTNTYFYQVTALRGKKTAVLRRIAAQQVKADSSMSGELKPVPDDFKGEPITRRIRDEYESPSVFIESFERAIITDPSESHFYSSWG